MITQPTLRSDLLKGQVAIVTGGSRGIGGATSEILAANGAHVVIADIDEVAAATTANSINNRFNNLSGSASVFIGDLVAEGICDQLVTDTLLEYGRLDIVVNNAGYAWDSSIHAMTDKQFQAMLDIHLIVPFRLARACAPVFRQAAETENAQGISNHRKFVLVSSLAGKWGLAGGSNYASAKAGMLGLMTSLTQEWGNLRVNCNSVCFGVIQTRLAQPQSEREVIHTGGNEIKVGMPHKQAERLGINIDIDHIPSDKELYTPWPNPRASLGRNGTIQEAADSIFWLCSPLANYVTGQSIVVSGGDRGGMS
ncbi:3-oxoacyl-ACP reductase FabG [Maricurvus nonylphenolicus]|uniref:SDR family NAD(P)-dependent oxidoreductase n=1 Tax=Maricurvus nonylphenolicus TaxID=1008307 RepID=UPI0036F27B99